MRTIILLTTISLLLPVVSWGQEVPVIHSAEGNRESFLQTQNVFSVGNIELPPEDSVQEVAWNFGDGIRTTGETVTHAYKAPGIYTVKLTLTTEKGLTAQDATQIRIFPSVALFVADNSVSEDQIEARRQEASKKDLLLLPIRTKSGGPEAAVEESLANQLLDARDAVQHSELIILQTAGSVGANALLQFAQHIQQAAPGAFGDLSINTKGIIMLSDTPFAVLAPAAQVAFNQMKPSYVLLTRPEAINTLLEPLSAEEAKNSIVTSTVGHKLLGEFSARTIRDIGFTNFLSFGINELVNKGVPLNTITLILMLPVIATILSFSRQVIGMKAFGIVTPAMTTLSFLVIGLKYGLLIFSVILVAGTCTRLIMRRFHLLYLPRMALVLTIISLSILVIFGIAAFSDRNALTSFSIFPILILILLAEEFIALQFKAGAKKAFTVTAWTLVLSIGCTFIVSWELLRTLFVSYPEIVLLALPINILLGRWTGLRLTEYIRFRKLFRSIQ